jgi:hypothetical protein
MVKQWDYYKYTILTAIIVFLGVAYYYIDPKRYQLIPKCPVKLLTNLDCPGCGFQRALHATFHGNFEEAVGYNLFLLVAIPIICIWCFNGLLIENMSNYHRKVILIHLNKWMIYFYIACYILWFIIRNV